MKKTFPALLLAAMLSAGAAAAQDSYMGLSATTSGEAKATFRNGLSSTVHNDPTSWKLYGGIKLNERFGLETGYVHSGEFRIANPAPGSTEEALFRSQILYGAGTASKAVTESLSVFGKAGLAFHRHAMDSTTFGAVRRDHAVRPMLGFGADYKIGKGVSAVLEYNHYGKGDNFKVQKLEAGLKVAF